MEYYLFLCKKGEYIMTQLIVNIEDVSLLSELKRAIMMLRGVVSISEKENVNETTLKAMEEAKNGNTIKCSSFEEYSSLN